MSTTFIPPEGDNPSDWASYYMGRGWEIVPARPGETFEPPDDWPGSAGGVEQVAGWFDRNPSYGIAIVTGVESDLVVLTTMGRWLVGGDSLAWLEGRYGDLPDTYEVRAPDSSRHLYFRHPEAGAIPADRRLCSSMSYVGADLNVSADGRVVYAPPSAYWYGPYRRRRASTLEVAELPEWLMTLACKPRISFSEAHRASRRGWGYVR